MNSKTIGIGSDHAGFYLKEQILKYLVDSGYLPVDFGCYSQDSVDYPDYAHLVANSISKGDLEFGILICGSGQGVCMTANKHNNVRASICWNSEISSLARQHNDSNIICLPARFLNYEQVIDILKTFLNTEFEGGRHSKRVSKIDIN
jgi:ribose 5-phosphate isomerase B